MTNHRTMIKLEEFQGHIKNIKQNDWNRLFSLLPEIEATKKFGEVKGGEKLDNGSFTLPYWSSSEIIDRVFHLIHELNLVPSFDWTSWEEGKLILKKPS